MKTRRSDKSHQKIKRKKEINKQLVIRFPQDIADAIHENNYNAQLNVHFIDSNNAECQIFDENFDAVLVSLPTIVETFRTTDGYHLFKSGEISDILLVYRQGERPTGITNDYKYAHGITPPTSDIVVKRKSKQEAIAITHHESFLDDVEYWDLAELQITTLMSKEKKLSKTKRTEIFEEPDIDPVILEKILRKNGYSEYKGYSGVDISQEEVDRFDMSELDYYLSHPSQYETSILSDRSNDQSSSSNDADSSEASDSNADEFFIEEPKKEILSANSDREDDSSNSDAHHTSNKLEDSRYSSNLDDESNENKNKDAKYKFFDDEDEEEEDPQEIIFHELNEKKKVLLTELENYRIQMFTNSSNNIIQEKIKNRISTIEENLNEIEEQMKGFNIE